VGDYTHTLGVNSDTHSVEVEERYHFTGKHHSIYERTKAQAHDLAKKMINESLPLVIVQPGMVYGPGDTNGIHTSLVKYLTGKLPVMPKQTVFSWGNVDDIARAHRLAMEKGRIGENCYICGSTYTFVNVMELTHEMTGIRLPRAVPPGMLRAMPVVVTLVDRFLPVPESYSGESLRSTASTTYIGTNAKAKRELGYAPRPLKEGLAETLKYEWQFHWM